MATPLQRDTLWGEVELFRFFFALLLRWCSKFFSEDTSTFEWAKKNFGAKKPRMTKKIDFEFQKVSENEQKSLISHYTEQQKSRTWFDFSFP